jgi:hypothetical protein
MWGGSSGRTLMSTATRSGRKPSRKEIVMNRHMYIRRIAGLLAGLAGAAVALGSTPAFASRVPLQSGGTAGAPVPAAPVQIHTIVAGGMPGWQIALNAAGAALVAATVAVLLDRATRRKPITTAA